MSNTSIEMDSAKAILNTYHQVNDTQSNAQLLKAKLHQKNIELENELLHLKEKYMLLKNELLNRDKKLNNLNQVLIEKTTHMARLQEDFEHAISQLSNKKE